MKKKVLSMVVVGVILLSFGGIVGASVYHIVNAANAKKANIEEQFNAYMEERDFKLKNDTSYLTEQEIERLNQEVDAHFQERAGADYQALLNQKSQEISAETDKYIQELNAYIDQLFESQ